MFHGDENNTVVALIYGDFDSWCTKPQPSIRDQPPKSRHQEFVEAIALLAMVPLLRRLVFLSDTQ